jgi:hypothetical protein
MYLRGVNNVVRNNGALGDAPTIFERLVVDLEVLDTQLLPQLGQCLEKVVSFYALRHHGQSLTLILGFGSAFKNPFLCLAGLVE